MRARGAPGTGPIPEEVRRTFFERHLLPPGSMLGGRYRVRAYVHSGGAGEVYEAEDVLQRRRVAVKLLYRSAREDGPPRLEEDLEFLLSLNHPGLVPVLDTGVHEGRRFVVSEFVEGEDLERFLRRRGPLDAAEAGRVALAVLEALEYLHGQGVLHHDIKPGNIMMTPAGPRLLDYGIARRRGLPAGDACLEGTLEYLAPELLEDVPAEPAADLYALAVVLYETLTGSRPISWRGGEPPGPGSAPPPLNADHLRRAGPAVWRVVFKGLAARQDLRYPSAAAMAGELRRALARPGEGGSDLERLRRRARWGAGRRRVSSVLGRLLPWAAAAAWAALAVGLWTASRVPENEALRLEGAYWVLHGPQGSVLEKFPAGVPPGPAALHQDRAGGLEVLIAIRGGAGPDRLALWRREPGREAWLRRWTRELPRGRVRALRPVTEAPLDGTAWAVLWSDETTASGGVTLIGAQGVPGPAQPLALADPHFLEDEETAGSDLWIAGLLPDGRQQVWVLSARDLEWKETYVLGSEPRVDRVRVAGDRVWFRSRSGTTVASLRARRP